ncbi:FAD-binding protein [Parvibacter caecicola]|uniref:FAD-binding protein n=1 Tax=Parvibacter caecicola TaxID=747645 RepID=UPI0023F002ED|nr:FAD-binding protein [Parvibacter caecicola]
MALSGLAAGTLAGCGKGYTAQEPNNPRVGDFGVPSWLGEAPVIEESLITETVETEVLVVGVGTGGIPAMISAAENGARVLGIDRQNSPRNVREDIGAVDSHLQQASFEEFPQFRIDKTNIVQEIATYANGFVNYDLVKLWANESGAMIDWLTDIIQRDGKMVMEFEGGVGNIDGPGIRKAFATGHSPQPTELADEEWGFAESILAYAAEQGAEVRWRTEFIKCEQDESGRVTGVIARAVDDDRHYLRINASKGVILSTGGYGEQPFLKLNLKGERFCNESGPYDYMLHAAYMQPHHTYVDIWDANHAEQAEMMDEVGCCRLFPFDNGARNNIPMAVVDGMIEKLIEDGYVQKADTMEELAQKLNLPVEATVASWQRYNEFAANGEDTDYWKEPHRLLPLTTPPFYGVRTGAWFLATIDGVSIDTNMHPTDADGNPIQGLYLTGNDSGGFFSVSYPNLMTGLACGRTMTFGRRAGMLAATGQA